MQQSNTFCPMPWIGMYYNITRGSVCCVNSLHYNSPTEIRSAPEIEQLRSDLLNNIRNPSCQVCWKQEDEGNRSMRNYYMSHLPSTVEEITSPNSLQYLELRVDNLCNFGCRICSPESSSLLSTELNEHNNLKIHYGYSITDPEFVQKKIKDLRWDEILALVPTLTNLQLTGGEPMLVKRFYDLLDHLVENEYCKNITLQITTNCSVLNPLIINRLKQFKKVFIVASIDAVMEVAEYQRYGTRWTEVENNCIEYAKLSNVEMVISSTVTAYTVLDFSRLSNFFMKLKFLNKNVNCLANVVLHKPQLLPTVLNTELRQRAISELEDSIEKLAGLGIEKQLTAILETIKTVDDSNKFNDFVAFTKDHDEVRNQSFEKTFGYKLY